MAGVTALLVSLIAATSISAATAVEAKCTAALVSAKWNIPPPGMKWVAAKGGVIPSGGVVGGEGSNGKPVYVCRAYYHGYLVPGKASESMGHCDIPWGGKEHDIYAYEVLVNVNNLVDLEWEDASDGNVPANAVAGGYTCHCNGSIGDISYIGRTKGISCTSRHSCLSSSVVFPGKISHCTHRFYWSYGGKGYHDSTYQAMVWKYKVKPKCTVAGALKWNIPPPGMEWVAAKGGVIPSGGVVGGEGSNGKPVYVCRAYYHDYVVPGKASESMGHCDVPWGGKEHDIYSYEVLVNANNIVDIEWEDASDGNVPDNAVAGGYTCHCNGGTGDISYIGRTQGVSCPSPHPCLSSSVVFPGKISHCTHRFYWSYGGKGYHDSTYQAMVWKYKST